MRLTHDRVRAAEACPRARAPHSRAVVLIGILLALGGAAASCGPIKVYNGSFVERADLVVQEYQVHFSNGVSNDLVVSVPDGLSSMLIEVRGSDGEFHVAQLMVPSDDDSGPVDVTETASFVTRDAREVPGLVDWLYPNSPSRSMIPGSYRLSITARDGGGALISDGEAQVRFYQHQDVGETAGLQVEFIICDGALDGDPQATVQAVTDKVSQIYAQVGVSLDSVNVRIVEVPSVDVVVGGTDPTTSALPIVAKALNQAQAGALHLVLVRTIDLPGGPSPIGYSLGLPGPYDPDRPNAAVLVAASGFAAPTPPLRIDTDAMATTIAHEMGHYLGLYHTSESDGSLHDPIDDTPECPPPGGVSECPDSNNIMFYTGGLARSILTEGQGIVMRRHPLAHPSDASLPSPSPRPPVTPNCPVACPDTQQCITFQGISTCAAPCAPSTATTDCPDGFTCTTADDAVTYACLSLGM
jgi:hypothetical protein